MDGVFCLPGLKIHLNSSPGVKPEKKAKALAETYLNLAPRTARDALARYQQVRMVMRMLLMHLHYKIDPAIYYNVGP